MERHRPEQPGKGPGDAHGAARFRGRAAALAQDLERQRRQRGRGILGVGDQGGEVGRRTVVQVAGPGLDQAVEVGAGQAVAAHRLGQAEGGVVARRMAGVDGIHGVAPPLQANLSDQRLAHHFADARHLLVEGIEGEQVFAFGRGGEKGAHSYIDNLWKKTSGFVERWEAESLKSFFTQVRNPFGHGPGSAKMPSLTSQQTDLAIELCISWIKSLIKRL